MVTIDANPENENWLRYRKWPFPRRVEDFLKEMERLAYWGWTLQGILSAYQDVVPAPLLQALVKRGALTQKEVDNLLTGRRAKP